MSGNELTVDQLRRMMLVFDPSYYTHSYADIAEEFTKSFANELDLLSSSAKSSSGDDDGALGDHSYSDPNNLRDTSPSAGIRSNEHFRFLLASTLITLLNDRFNSQRRIQNHTNRVIDHGFFKPLQRLIALYLVYNLYKHKPIGHHPFLPHFMRIIEHCPEDRDSPPTRDITDDEDQKATESKKDRDSSPQTFEDIVFEGRVDENRLSARFAPLCDKIEAEFIVKLLFNRDIDLVSKMSATEFSKIYRDKLLNHKLEKWPDFAQIQQIISSRQNKNFLYSPLKTLGIHPVLRDYDPDLDLKLAPFALDENGISDLALSEEFNYSTFDPEMVRPTPPMMLPFGRHEVRWMFLGESPKLMWDDTECKAMDKKEIVDLLKLALRQPLGEEDTTAIITEMKSWKQHRNLSGFVSADCLHSLVIHNPKLVVPLFLVLRPNQMNEYFNGLCTLDVADVEKAQKAFTVMTQIAEKVKIPKKFIIQFISHCIKTCENTKEPFHQTRLIKHICGFVQDLIHQSIISTKDSAVEIEPFCLEFSRIKEAQNLYKLLKNLGNSPSDSGSSSRGGSNDHDTHSQ